MKKLLIVLLLFALPLSAKVYDCFLFFNETEVLKIRLAELYPIVDYFVLVQSPESHQGNLKPLYFGDHKEDFAPYLDKVIHVVIEAHPEITDPMAKEIFQRNAIARGLKGAKDSDIVFLSDCDEIPKRSQARKAIRSLRHKPKQFFVFDQKNYLYKLNTIEDKTWHGTVVSTYRKFKKIGGENYRERRRSPVNYAEHIPNGGWHFSYIGNETTVEQKMKHFSHPEQLEEIDIWLTHFRSLPTVPIDHTFPKYIRDNEEYFKTIGFINPY